VAQILPVSAFGMNNDALDPMDEFERTIAAVLQRLCGFTPATIENGVRGGHARGRSSILASHDADENADRRSSVAAREGTNFNKSLGHASSLA
jgi:hypothetical protein